MDTLRQLYEEVILDHNRHPRHFHKKSSDANREAHGFNPLCGDEFTVYLTVQDGLIKDIGFEGHGCAISTASASLMTEALLGKTETEAEQLFQIMRSLLTEELPTTVSEQLGKLRVLEGVKEFPSRVKCATLAWHTLHAALAQQQEAVTTE